MAVRAISTCLPMFPRMEFQIRRTKSGVTLFEMLIAIGIGSAIFAVVALVLLQFSRTTTSLYGYATISARDRVSIETIARDFRNAEAIGNLSATNVSLILNTQIVQLAYDAPGKRLCRISAGTNQVLLPNCRNLNFHFLTRSTSGAFENFPVNSTNCKIVQMTWFSASSSNPAAPTVPHSVRFLNRQP